MFYLKKIPTWGGPPTRDADCHKRLGPRSILAALGLCCVAGEVMSQ